MANKVRMRANMEADARTRVAMEMIGARSILKVNTVVGGIFHKEEIMVVVAMGEMTTTWAKLPNMLNGMRVVVAILVYFLLCWALFLATNRTLEINRSMSKVRTPLW
jgi:hypothetical protein